MKTIFTLLLSAIFAITSFAYDGTRLTISSISKNKMFVEVNGQRYNMDGNTISVRDLRTGYQTVKIYREVKKNNNRWFDFGIGVSKRQEIIYNNRVYLKTGYHFDIVVNRFGKVLIDERRIDNNDEWFDDDEDGYDRDYDRNGDRDERDNRNQEYENYSRIMNDHDFNQAKESLRREWFENTRVNTAKQVMDGNYFSAAQVKDLLQLFTFENNKLDLAKYAYRKVVDRNNYHIINDAFTFSNSREELARFIREYK